MQGLAHLYQVCLAVVAHLLVEVVDGGDFKQFGPVVVLLEDVEQLGGVLVEVKLLGHRRVGALQQEAFGKRAQIPLRQHSRRGHQACGPLVRRAAQEIHLYVELRQTFQQALRGGDGLAFNQLEGVAHKHRFAQEGQVLTLYLHHTVAHSAHYLKLRGQGIALLEGLHTAEETVDHPVVDSQHRLGVTVAHRLVEQEAQRGYVDAVALAVGDVHKAYALWLEDAIRHHLYLVVHQGAKHGVLAVVVHLRGQLAERCALFYHSAFAGILNNDFYLLHSVT